MTRSIRVALPLAVCEYVRYSDYIVCIVTGHKNLKGITGEYKKLFRARGHVCVCMCERVRGFMHFFIYAYRCLSVTRFLNYTHILALSFSSSLFTSHSLLFLHTYTHTHTHTHTVRIFTFARNPCNHICALARRPASEGRMKMATDVCCLINNPCSVCTINRDVGEESRDSSTMYTESREEVTPCGC